MPLKLSVVVVTIAIDESVSMMAVIFLVSESFNDETSITLDKRDSSFCEWPYGIRPWEDRSRGYLIGKAHD